MSIRPWRDIARRRARQIHMGGLAIGGDAPISVQTMTNTVTADARATLNQIHAATDAGADIVRVSCPDTESTAALKQIVREARVPLVADIHFHYKRALEAASAGAACLRINPGNIGGADRVREVVQAAKDHGYAIRIGVNASSLERELLENRRAVPGAMVESALNHLRLLQDHDFHEVKISVKTSTCFWRSRRIMAWPRPAIIRCIWGSPRPAACASARSNRRSAWARCCGPGLATLFASLYRPTRSRKCAPASIS